MRKSGLQFIPNSGCSNFMKRLPRWLITVLLTFGCTAAILLPSMQAVTLPALLNQDMNR